MKTESKERLVPSDPESPNPGEDVEPIPDAVDYILSQVEKKFLLSAERGDCAGVRR